MKKISIQELHDHIGDEVVLAGWVHVRRDHGKLVFIDLRDASGVVQMVALPNHEEVNSAAHGVRPEWVLEITGNVNKRPEKMIQRDEENGDIEIEITRIIVLNEAETSPFEIVEDTKNVDENTRINYRYLDLRTERMQKNMIIRSAFIRGCRNFLDKKQFIEIETPLLTESTAEGARDFVVPSRLHPGKFYALPQSPQQYKQLLMVAGFERYYQIARAIRDEDLRADRGFEFTQVDIELSFTDMNDVMSLVEEMIISTVEDMGYVIKEKPFPKISYKDAIKKYGDDRFDLRTDEEKEKGILAYAWVTEFPFFERTEQGTWTFTHNPFSMPVPEHVEQLLHGENIGDIKATQYDLVCNGFESGGGSIRAHKPEILKATYKILGYSDEETEKSIGHMLEAFKYGVPPHGGIALGVERNIMNLTGEDSLREVQAFPMTRGGQISVMQGPASITEKQLKELGISVVKGAGE